MKYSPLKMHPCYKDYLWGGSRLKKEYGKTDAPAVTAESWELACREDGMCTIENGKFAGYTLKQVFDIHPEYIGAYANHLPLLVKLIDAKQDLSIQVHPSDLTARPELGETGKAEMWYVIDAEPHAVLYYGLKQEITAKELVERAVNGTICEVLNCIPIKRGDVFDIQPGTIHAIGAGALIAEIQQNSNTTFRVYDYLRKDKDGKLRPLHLKRAAEVANLKPVLPQECRINIQLCFSGYRISQLFSGNHFEVYKIEVFQKISLSCTHESFAHLLVIQGDAILQNDDEGFQMHAGDSWFLPAGLGKYIIEGECVVLLSKMNEGGE